MSDARAVVTNKEFAQAVECDSSKSSWPASSRSSIRQRSVSPEIAARSSDPTAAAKSNIIDAVRWVMGESSARQLRGESLTDVIFNGSTTRKPTALASIELMFDNSDGRIGGEYADYAEIAIRRQVTRDAQSELFPERHQVPPPRHHGHLPRHRVRPAQLLDHRAGHDQPAGRGEARRPAASTSKKRPGSPSTRNAAAKPKTASATPTRTSSG